MGTHTGADGTTLHYDEVGTSDRTPLVTLAGGAARHPEYLGDLDGLADRYPLVVPHLRGVGRTALAGDASYWGQASDVESLRGHLGLDRVVLLGHSAGTRLATAYAARFPDRVAAMVLICPSPRPLVDVPSDAEAIMDRRRGDPVVDAALATRLAGPGDGQVEEWYRRTAPLVYATWGERERVHAARARWYPAAAEAYFSVDPPPDFASRMRSLTAPVLVVAGAEDCVTGLAPVLALARLFPAGQLALLESCGHFPWIEQPEAFHAAVGPFLDAQTRTDGPRWAT